TLFRSTRTHLLARAFVRVGRALAQRMHAAMNVRVIAALLLKHRLEHDVRALGRRGVVEIDEPFAVHLLIERGEPRAQRCDVGDEPLGTSLGTRAHRKLSHSTRPARPPATRATARSRSGAGSRRPSSTLANANVSSARALSASRPRERR